MSLAVIIKFSTESKHLYARLLTYNAHSLNYKHSDWKYKLFLSDKNHHLTGYKQIYDGRVPWLLCAQANSNAGNYRTDKRPDVGSILSTK